MTCFWTKIFYMKLYIKIFSVSINLSVLSLKCIRPIEQKLLVSKYCERKYCTDIIKVQKLVTNFLFCFIIQNWQTTKKLPTMKRIQIEQKLLLEIKLIIKKKKQKNLKNKEKQIPLNKFFKFFIIFQ